MKFNIRKAAIDAGDIIGIFIVLLLGAALLPGALNTWYAAVAVNGTLETAPDEFITMWNLVPLGVALAVFAGIIVVGMQKLRQMS